MPPTALPTETSPNVSHLESQPAAHAVTCMEIWGGNSAINNAVSTPGIDAWVYSRPFRNEASGGDIHYVSMCASGRIARFVVADVSGHGGEVSDIATSLRDLMRRNINTVDQTKFTRAVNDQFQATGNADGHFATALLATYFAPTDQLIVCNAGHPRPLWYRAAKKTWTSLHHQGEGTLTEAHDLPLGIIDPTAYSQFAVGLSKGDLVLLMTDGLLEARNPKGKMLGEEGAIALLHELDASDPSTLLPKVLERLGAYLGGEQPDDDVTLVLLHHNASEPPSYSLGTHIKAIAKMVGLLPV